MVLSYILPELMEAIIHMELFYFNVLDKNPLLNMQADYFLRQSVTIRQRKERLTIVWTLKKILRYLKGTELTVSSNHQLLQWLFTLKSQSIDLLDGH
ncbi:hypothetical protein CEXT_259631 [Caerostris extrusa]|uniref:Reverse transcriptase RNase H-like domain-containing protein n=1 Tax=Caerostris extrusa TaxID=172846 RepID=A0AAV4VHE8_CAEEX|nr:hypothetical protein CEXT_259631 [Caerostris extrusa]